MIVNYFLIVSRCFLCIFIFGCSFQHLTVLDQGAKICRETGVRIFSVSYYPGTLKRPIFLNIRDSLLLLKRKRRRSLFDVEGAWSYLEDR